MYGSCLADILMYRTCMHSYILSAANKNKPYRYERTVIGAISLYVVKLTNNPLYYYGPKTAACCIWITNMNV